MYACIRHEPGGGNGMLVPYPFNIDEKAVFCLKIRHQAQLPPCLAEMGKPSK